MKNVTWKKVIPVLKKNKYSDIIRMVYEDFFLYGFRYNECWKSY